MEVASSGDSERGAGRDDVVDCLQGFPALAAVWIVGLGSVAGIVIAALLTFNLINPITVCYSGFGNSCLSHADVNEKSRK